MEHSIGRELRLMLDLLAKSRALSLKPKRTGDILLRREAYRMRKEARFHLRMLRREQLCKMVTERYKGGTKSSPFWNKSKRHFRDKSVSLRAFISMSGEITKDTKVMAESAANYYEQLFTEPEVYRPHPYIDSQPILWDNNNDTIPLVSYPELVRVLKAKTKKSSCDAHVLNDRGLLPDNQFDFRANHRLQSRVLLLIDQIYSLMVNSSPVCTVFVDFRSAFDQLWFDGCVGKRSRLGIPATYAAWIKEWLTNRRGYIDIQGTCSRWLPIKRGGPQGSCLTPSIFITYHSDMSDAFPMAMSF
ncbi:unnamed protein product [Rotaria magnacalcarata]